MQPGSFFISLSSELKRLGCKQCSLDPTLYFKIGSDGKLHGVILTHVDDFLHCGDSVFERDVMCPLIKRFIAGRCSCSDFNYVGLHLRQDPSGEIYLDQNEYLQSLDEPDFSVGLKRGNEDLSLEEYSVLRSLVGALNWLVCGSRPDLAYDVLEHSSKFRGATRQDLFLCIKSVRKCKRESVYNKFPCLDSKQAWRLVVFSDASYANLPDGFSSCVGYVVFLVDEHNASCPITWKANKAKRVCRSTLAAETMALVDGVEDCLYLRSILGEAGIARVPIIGVVDSKSLFDAIHSTKLVDGKRLRIEKAALQEFLGSGVLDEVKWCPSSKQLANSLTKRGASACQLLEVMQTGSINSFFLLIDRYPVEKKRKYFF